LGFQRKSTIRNASIPGGFIVSDADLNAAAATLEEAVETGQVEAASLCVLRSQRVFARSFGAAKSANDIFLVASISKPMSAAALMTLYDQGLFRLDDPVCKYVPEFHGGARERITIQQLLTHVSGLPDQLPENLSLRKAHAPLSEFLARTIRTPLLFEPGAQYSYSSMGILLASEVAHRITGEPFIDLIHRVVFQPLEMTRSALGLGRFRLEDTHRCQLQGGSKQSNRESPAVKAWDRNSEYWRNLGAPWGGVHASARDVAKFFSEFLHPTNRILMADTVRLMLQNHNRRGLQPRGLGFALGIEAGSQGCSEQTFGHEGITGTLAWADPTTDTICVVLTTLPAGAADPHPRELVSRRLRREA
jgi:CubicO group peptidase (beta-lactamase class C family)